MRRLLLGVVLALAFAPALVHAADGTLNIGLREDPDVLDPTLGSSGAGRIVYAAMCNKLFDIDAQQAIVPQLATGFDYADPTHLIIHLRQGVTFQDGETMDAEAVKTSLMRDLTAKGSMRAGEINAIQAIEVIDPATVRLVLKAPASQMLAQLADRAASSWPRRPWLRQATGSACTRSASARSPSSSASRRTASPSSSASRRTASC